MQLELSKVERDELLGILSNYSSDLQVEVRRTDNSKFKRQLRNKRLMVRKLVDRLEYMQPFL